MNLKQIIPVIAFAFALAACNDRVHVNDNGLKYQIHDEGSDERKSKVGDVLTFHLKIKNSKDSILRDTHKEGQPFQQLLQVPGFKGDFNEGLAMMTKGDSMTFFISADTLFARMGQQMPPNIEKGSEIRFIVRMLEIQNEKEFQTAREAKGKKQKDIDAKIIDEYIAKNKLTATKTASGLAYVVTQAGNGPKPQVGDVPVIIYSGKLTNGKPFDSSNGKSMDFPPAGTGQVIPGFDEAILNMTKGSKHTVIIPSTLAYGENSPSPNLPANSVLIFDLELVDIKKK